MGAGRICKLYILDCFVKTYTGWGWGWGWGMVEIGVLAGWMDQKSLDISELFFLLVDKLCPCGYVIFIENHMGQKVDISNF